eukprot:TRINITY_DN17423_c0_g1_i1.p2 TRINITY_DN17423_c0_g1~~TRINITY_DN17423_c0_g1_i1.p2  ORF type:complete len:253 (+),score=43.77 TRINITY_DN17423_c0_g1_i1:122-880(+)
MAGGAACSDQCQVLQDVHLGWEDTCIGLVPVNESTTASECRRRCCGDPECEVWQWGNHHDIASTVGPGKCLLGKGIECSSDPLNDFLVLAGQRISHTTVSRREPLATGRWCTGDQMRQAPLAGGSSFSQNSHTCKKVCYDDNACALWEYSSARGCWYGASDLCVHMGAKDLGQVTGERIWRACGDSGLVQETDYVMVFGIIGLVAFSFTCLAMLVVLAHARLSTPKDLSFSDLDDDERPSHDEQAVPLKGYE